MKAQESIQQFCVQERITDVEGNHFKMGVDDWDIIGQCTSSLMTVAAVVKQAKGDKYPTSSRKMLSFCDNKYFPWKDDSLGYLAMDLNFFLHAAYSGRSERLGWTSQAS
jgi:hypothetical protein